MFGNINPNINTEPSITDMFYDIITIGKAIQNRNEMFDVILGVSRGGLFPAVVLSHMLEVPLVPVTFSGADGAGDTKANTEIEVLPEFEEGTRILIVDDICDSGDTLKKMLTFYRKLKCPTKTAVVFYKDKWPNLNPRSPKHGYVPDFLANRVGVDSRWIIFPWENITGFLKDMVRQQQTDNIDSQPLSYNSISQADLNIPQMNEKQIE